MRDQLKEINGLVEFDRGLYHNGRYNDLLKTVMPLRREFPKVKDMDARKQMAKAEFDAWYKYLQERKQDLPKPDYEMDPKDLSQVKENFDRFKVTLLPISASFRTERICA